jgi:hypothetical protein
MINRINTLRGFGLQEKQRRTMILPFSCYEETVT